MVPDHIKRVTVSGKSYLYFVTTKSNAEGRPILVRMPALNDPSFWPTYAGHMKGRAKKPRDVLNVPGFVNLYLESPKFKKLAAATRKAYTIYLRRFAEQLAPAPAGDISRADILQVTDKMTPGAANLFVGCVGALYRWGRQRSYVDNDPCRDIEKNEVGEHEPWPDSILETALQSDDDVVRLAVHLLYYTAQRISDVVKMRWSDIGVEKMRVVQQKTGMDLSIQIHSSLARELKRHPRSLATILCHKGQPFRIDKLRMAIKNFADGHGVKVVPHGLRKNAVNALLEAGCTAAQAAAVSGQSLQMVEHYARRRNRAKLGATAILNWEREENANRKMIGK